MINEQKKILRELCSKKRNILKSNDNNLSLELTKNIKNLKEIKEVNNIASFISIKTEISTCSLNSYLFSINKKICLPVILNNSEYLIFRSYTKKTTLIKGKYDILEPDINNEELLPDVILTPCLAFDLNGYRLGYGGGYYDKTFANMKKKRHKFISIALAYDGQKIDNVLNNELDQKVDYILTEKNIYKIK